MASGSTWTSLPILSSTEAGLGHGGGEGEEQVRSITRASGTTNGLSNSNILYAGIDVVGTWRSIDDGVTWTKNPDNGLYAKGIQSLKVDPTNPAIVYARGAITTSYVNGGGMASLQPLEGVYRSVDSGTNWTQVASIPNLEEFDLNWLFFILAGR